MENTESAPRTNKLVLLPLVILILIAIVFAGVWLLTSDITKTAPVSLRELVSREEDNTNSLMLEKKILEDYYTARGLTLPQDYDSVTEFQKVLLMRKGVIEREVRWKSGAVFFISNQPSTEANARAILEDYRRRAQNSDDLLSLATEFNKDPRVISFNGGNELSYVFVHTTLDRRLFASNDIQSNMMSRSTGVVSDIMKDNTNDLTFFVINDSFNGPFETYKEWLNSASQGKVKEPSKGE